MIFILMMSPLIIFGELAMNRMMTPLGLKNMFVSPLLYHHLRSLRACVLEGRRLIFAMDNESSWSNTSLRDARLQMRKQLTSHQQPSTFYNSIISHDRRPIVDRYPRLRPSVVCHTLTGRGCVTIPSRLVADLVLNKQ